jgi:phage gp16-like protein
MNRQLQRTIFAACRELGLDSDARHDLQLRVTGKDSLSDMTDDEMKAVLDDLKSRGFRVSRGSRRKRARLAPTCGSATSCGDFSTRQALPRCPARRA